MIVTIFRSRLRPQTRSEYAVMSKHLGELVKTLPGYIAHKTFVAEDEERLMLVEFESEEGLRAWASHPEHVEAKKLGRGRFFAEYRVQICHVIKDRNISRLSDATPDALA